MASGKSLLKEFQQFIMRGNVLDLAVAVIIGVAFNAVVNALVNDIIMPIVAAIFGKPSFNDLYFTINHSRILYGAFITEVINFLIIAASVFLILKVFTSLQERRKGSSDPADEIAPTDEALLLGEIRDVLVAQGGRGQVAGSSGVS